MTGKPSNALLDKMRRTLIEKKRELLGLCASPAEQAVSAKPADDTDQIAESHDEFVAAGLGTLACEKLQLMNHALERMDRGEFGICRGCGEEIAFNRLKAVPWVIFCVSCQQNRDAALTLSRTYAREDPLRPTSAPQSAANHVAASHTATSTERTPTSVNSARPGRGCAASTTRPRPRSRRA